jgi:iron(III) transport system ATP-binding protein
MREETLTILKETRATCMVVTHSSEEAMRMGNRVALMRAGRLVQAGTAEELYHAPADIGAARMFSDLNEIACTVSKGKVDTPLGRYPAKGFAEGDRAILCVRHRDIEIVKSAKGNSARVLNTRFLGESGLPAHAGVQGGSAGDRSRHQGRPGRRFAVSGARRGGRQAAGGAGRPLSAAALNPIATLACGG